MTLLQLGIGTVNDLVDAPSDAGRKAGKPIPAGLVVAAAARAARRRRCSSAGAAPRRVGQPRDRRALPLVVIAIGLAYDLRLKGTAWSWLPFAVGIPILPVFGWLGAAGTPSRGVRRRWCPLPSLAGAALAIGNASSTSSATRRPAGPPSRPGSGPGGRPGCPPCSWRGVVVIAVGSAVLAAVAPIAVAGLAAAGLAAIAAAMGGAAAVRESTANGPGASRRWRSASSA